MKDCARMLCRAGARGGGAAGVGLHLPRPRAAGRTGPSVRN
jgi:hypothetical protein